MLIYIDTYPLTGYARYISIQQNVMHMQQIQFTPDDYFTITEQPMAGTSVHNFLKVLSDNHFHIDAPFLPRALYVLSMATGLTPFRMYEKRKYQKAIEHTPITNPLFIIGHFRSGTTFLHYLLGQDDNLGYVSTFETMTPGMIIANEPLFKNIVKNHLPAKRPMDDLEMHANLPYEEEYAIANLSPHSFYLGWYFPQRWKYYFDKYVTHETITEKELNAWKKTYTYFLKKISLKKKCHHLLLKSLVDTAKIKVLIKLFPNAKFIHIYRNPYKVYLSTWKLYQKILPIFSFQHIDSETLDENILYSYQQLYKHFFSQKHLIPKQNLIEFSYETFVSNPLSHIKKIYDQLDIPSFQTAEQSLKNYIHKHRNYKADTYNFTDGIKDKVYHRWKTSFETFEYEY